MIGKHLDVVHAFRFRPAGLGERRVGAHRHDLDLVGRQGGDLPVELAGFQGADTGIYGRNQDHQHGLGAALA